LDSLRMIPEPQNVEAWKSAIPGSVVRFRTILKPSESLPVFYPVQARVGGGFSYFVNFNTFDVELVK